MDTFAAQEAAEAAYRARPDTTHDETPAERIERETTEERISEDA